MRRLDGRLLLPLLLFNPTGDFYSAQAADVLGDATIDLIEEGIDVAFRGNAARGPNYIVRKIVTSSIGLVASPAYLAKHGTPDHPGALAKHSFVLLEAHTFPAPTLTLVRGRRTERVPMTGPIVSNSLGMVRAVAAAGGGIGVLPHRMGAELVAEGRLVRVLPQWEASPVDISYVIPARRLLPAKTRLFVEALAGHFRQPPDQADRRRNAKARRR